MKSATCAVIWKNFSIFSLVAQVHFLPYALDEVHPAPHEQRIAGDVENERMLSFRGDGKRHAVGRDALGFGEPKHDHAVKVIKVNASSAYHKK